MLALSYSAAHCTQVLVARFLLVTWCVLIVAVTLHFPLSPSEI